MKKLLKFVLYFVLVTVFIGTFAPTPMFGKILTGKSKCVDNTVMLEVRHHVFWIPAYSDWDRTGAHCS